MSCGFGAVILVFLIINHESTEQQETNSQENLSSNRQLDYQLQLEKEKLAELELTLKSLEAELNQTTLKTEEEKRILASKTDELSNIETESAADQKSIKRLRSEIISRSRDVEQLRSKTTANPANQIRSFEGAGDRQYLTGLKVDGKNIVIALDTSTSMLDETIVNILIRRNKSPEEMKEAPKWKRAVRTVEWVSAQLPLDAEFQVYGFNEKAESFLPLPNEGWFPMEDGSILNQAIDAIKRTSPKGGTSLENLVSEITKLTPLPDNVYLITDGLPTLSDKAARGALVSGRKRIEYFRDAINKLPKQVPINVILFPIEGDPMAAAEFWNLARITKGAFISPSRDWP